VLAAAGAAVLVLAAWPIPAIVVEDIDGGGRVAAMAAPEGTILALRYRHSLHGGLVWEHLRVRDGALVVEAVEAEREAAAEYYRLASPIRRNGARFRVDGLARRLPDLVVRATRLGERALVAAPGVLTLGDAARDGHRIAITVRRWPRALVCWAARTTPWTREDATTGG